MVVVDLDVIGFLCVIFVGKKEYGVKSTVNFMAR